MGTWEADTETKLGGQKAYRGVMGAKFRDELWRKQYWVGRALDHDAGLTVLATITGSSGAKLAREDPHLGQKWLVHSPCPAIGWALPWKSGLGLKAEAEPEGANRWSLLANCTLYSG